MIWFVKLVFLDAARSSIGCITFMLDPADDLAGLEAPGTSWKTSIALFRHCIVKMARRC